MKKEPSVQIVNETKSHMKERINLSFFALMNVSNKNKLHTADINGMIMYILLPLSPHNFKMSILDEVIRFHPDAKDLFCEFFFRIFLRTARVCHEELV